MAFERFTDRARQTVLHAQEAAVEMGHEWIGCEHLLLGLCQQGDGVAGVVLARHGIGVESVKASIVELVGTTTPSKVSADVALASVGIDLAEVRRRVQESFGARALPDDRTPVPFTPRARDALQRSVTEASALQHEYIGTEHVLLGLLGDDGNLGRQILVEAGLDLDALRQDVLELAAVDHLRLEAAQTKLNRLFALYLDPDTKPAVEEVYEQTTRDIGAARARASAARVELVHQLADDLEAAMAKAEASLAATGMSLVSARGPTT